MKAQELKARVLAGAQVNIPVGYIFKNGKKGWRYLQLDSQDVLADIESYPDRIWDVEPMDPESEMYWNVWVYSVKEF